MLEISALTRSFRKPMSRQFRRVLGPVDVEVGEGDRLAVTGANGAGKSTLLRCIAGTVAPTSGTVMVGGHEAGSLAARRMIGVSFSQERSFYLRLTGWQNLLIFARLREPDDLARALVERIVSELELETIAARRVDRCSTGMVQQLAIGRALLGDPQLLLLDEPTRSLDQEAIARFWRALDARRDRAVVLISHRPEDVAHCERHLALAPH
jgi:ABC-type multidrug transport system ATPase subunit